MNTVNQLSVLLLGVFLTHYSWSSYSDDAKYNAKNNADNSAKTEIYSATFFSEYTPQTAFDMIERLPGFSLIETNDDVRGFASGVGNILIDGRRPTTKSGGLKEALTRIPAKQVKHITILRGASGNSDSLGQSVVANIVRNRQESAKYWSLTLASSDKGKISPTIEAVLSSQMGQWNNAFKLTATQTKAHRDAVIHTLSGNDNSGLKQIEERPSTLNEVFLSGDGKRTFSGGENMTFNARIGWSQFLPITKRQHDTDINNTSNNLTDQFYNKRDSQYYTGEIGAEWKQPVNDHWDWRMLTIHNAQHWFVDSYSESSQDNRLTFQHLDFEENKSEHILRNVLLNKANNGYLTQQEYGLEVAYSQLDSRLLLSDDLLVLRSNYSEAEETRTEIFSNFSWAFEPIQAKLGIAVEQSKLSVSGDSRDSQSLTYFKPSLALVYDSSPDTQYRLNLRRHVGQLDFSDFAASADLVNEREFSGNSQLKPETMTKAEIAMDHHFGNKGIISVALYREWRQGVLEQIQLASNEYALGNAGNATVDGLQISLQLPLERWLSGAELDASTHITHSNFFDPITNSNRGLTQIDSPVAQISFRQDLLHHQTSWGIGYQFYSNKQEFYINEHGQYKTHGYWNVFIENSSLNDLKMRFSIENLGKKEVWQRSIFTLDRSGSLRQRERIERRQGYLFSVNISHNL